ncbi:MAG: hypothetical protein ACHQ49_05215 [Elusimicrobiota bacterium]
MTLGRTLAAAQNLAAAPGAAAVEGAVAASAAGAAIAPVPLSYQARLLSDAPSPAAGPAFLNDAKAQAWFRQNRPAAVPALTRQALALSDWKQVLSIRDSPRLMREAIFSRQDVALGRDAAALLALLDRDPELTENRAEVELAVLEWSRISAETRAALAGEGIDETIWPGLSIARRYEAVRRIYHLAAAETITAAPGTAEYAAQFEKILMRSRGLMTNEELDSRRRELKLAQDAAAALQRARDAVAKAGSDAESAGLLAAAEDARDLDEIARRLEPLNRRLGLGAPPVPRAAEPIMDLSLAEKAGLENELFSAILTELRGDPVGEEIRAFLIEHPRRLIVGSVRHGAAAFYDADTGDIHIGESLFVRTAASLGHSPRELLSDPRARREMAIAFAAVVVHETIHARQYHWVSDPLGRRAGEKVYSQQWELEAFAAQDAFLRGKKKSDTAYFPLAERLRAAGGPVETLLDEQAPAGLDSAEFRRGLLYGYRQVPTLERVGARLIRAGQDEELGSADFRRSLAIELAWRRRANGGARRESSTASEFSGISTARLRATLREWSERGARTLVFVEGLIARSSLELKRFSPNAAPPIVPA